MKNVKHIIIMIGILVSSLFIFAYAQTVNQDGSVTVTFPVETVVKCVNQGGCALLTAAEVVMLRNEAVRENCSKTL